MIFSKASLVFVVLNLTLVTSAVAGDMAKIVESCAACHGVDGVSTDTDIPSIAGQPAKYLAKTFAEFKGKERICPETAYRSGPLKDQKTDMCKAVDVLSDDDIKALVTLYAGKKFVKAANQKFDPALAAKGKDIHKDTCEKCHTDGGTTSTDDSSLLAGQQMGYLANAFKELLSEKRAVNKKMKERMDEMNKDKLNALVHYYGSQK
jgi:sulfide dehydrogenase cytochrome subunit